MHSQYKDRTREKIHSGNLYGYSIMFNNYVCNAIHMEYEKVALNTEKMLYSFKNFK